MAKTLSIAPTSIDFGNVDIYQTSDSSVVLTPSGSDTVTFTGITSDSKFTIRKGTDPFSNSISGFSIAPGSEFVRQFGGTPRDYGFGIVFDGSQTFYVAGYSLPGTPFDGVARPNSSNYAVWVQKYTISALGIISNSWTRIIDDAVNDMFTGGDCLTVDDLGNVWVCYVNNPSGTSGTNGKVYVSKIAADNSTISSLLIYDGTGEQIKKYNHPITFWNDYIFVGLKTIATPDVAYIARVNPGAVTLAENKAITGASTSGIPLSFRTTDSTYLDMLFAEDLTGSDDYTYALSRINLDGSDNIVLYDYQASDVPTNYTDPYVYNGPAMVMQNQYAYLVKSEDLFFAKNVNYGTVAYWDVSGTAGSRIKSLKTDIYSVSGTTDFQEEFEVKFNSIAADSALSAEYISAGNYRRVYFEAANQKIVFIDNATSDTMSSNNNVITSTATVYKIRVSRISGTGKIEVDSGAGYVDVTNSETMNSSWSALETNLFFGIDREGGSYDTDCNLYFWKRWIDSTGGSFTDANLVLNLDRTASAHTYDHFIVNQAVGSYMLTLGTPTNYYLRSGAARTSDKRIFVGGRIAGIEYQSGVGVPSGTGDPIFGIYDSTGNISKKQFSTSTDGFVEGCTYEPTLDLAVCTGNAREGFEGQTNPGPGNYSAIYFGMTTTHQTELEILPGETETIDVRFSPDGYRQTFSGTMTLTSDATSSPDTVTLAGECQPKDIETYEVELTADTRLDSLSRLFYGKSGFEREIIEANKHLTKEMIKSFFIPAHTRIVKPDVEGITPAGKEKNVPSWRR